MEFVAPSIGLTVWAIVSLVGLILPIICLISVLRHDFKNNDKLIWVIIIVFIPFLGSILYLLIGRKNYTNPSI
ncbi:PLDc N-terminal domain-containing protein [Pelobium manganitolerans]|uniref:PLDc N-terminal domain-containing protein n=1 Tax=Pelobium manganitolerans TaxID=1842495 RepID=UPI003FA38FB2